MQKNELSQFYAGMNAFGLAWGRLGSEPMSPVMIRDVQGALQNAIAGIQAAPCIGFDVNKIRNFSSRLPTISQPQAVNEINQLIRELQAAIQRAAVACDKGASFEGVFIAGVHLGAAQAIANTFIGRMIPTDWQNNLRNHLITANNGLSGFQACIPGFNFSHFNNVPINAANAYEPFSVIVGIHTNVVRSIALTECSCKC